MVLAILAVSVSLTLNIDSLQLARDLWRNPDGRATLVGQADALVESGSPSGGPPKDGPVTAPPEIVAIQKLCTPNPPRQPDMFTTTDEATKSLGEVENCVRDALNKVSGLNVIDRPIWKQQAWRHDWAKSWAWLLHTLGLAGTAVALTLGAPFWFQLIKRLTGLRGDKAPRT